jgi:hypothetical protein
MGLPPRSLAHRCARPHHGSDPLGSTEYKAVGGDSPPPWQARLRSPSLLAITEMVNGKTESQCLRSSPDATELAVLLGAVKEWA